MTPDNHIFLCDNMGNRAGPNSVIPAQAGIQFLRSADGTQHFAFSLVIPLSHRAGMPWIPACAGMTE